VATLDENIAEVLQGNAAAIECFMLIRDVLHFWDDLIDKDHTVSDAYIHGSMFKALVALPTNDFYRRFQDMLQPVLVNAIANWHAANAFEAGEDERLLQIAFVVRSDYANILIQMAYIIGGYDWVTAVTPVIRRMWTTEDFTAYKANLEREKAARTTGDQHVL